MSVSVEAKEKKSIIDIIREHLEIISEKAGIDAKLVITGLAVCLFFVFIGYFDFYITNVVGVVYPAFWSIRAIESPDSEDDKQWLTYWVVFALFSLLDLFSGFLLKFIPFYFFIKLIFLIWLFMPNFRGATFVYDKFLYRLFKRYEKDIAKLGTNLGQKLTGAVDAGKTAIRDNQGKIINAGINLTGKVVEASNKSD